MFTSRNDTLRFYNLLKKYNGFCSIISTPHSLSKSCGISVRLSGNLVGLAKQMLSSNNFATFNGIYEINLSTPGNIPTRIY